MRRNDCVKNYYTIKNLGFRNFVRHETLRGNFWPLAIFREPKKCFVILRGIFWPHAMFRDIVLSWTSEGLHTTICTSIRDAKNHMNFGELIFVYIHSYCFLFTWTDVFPAIWSDKLTCTFDPPSFSDLIRKVHMNVFSPPIWSETLVELKIISYVNFHFTFFRLFDFSFHVLIFRSNVYIVWKKYEHKNSFKNKFQQKK